jgi:arylsulfatase A
VTTQPSRRGFLKTLGLGAASLAAPAWLRAAKATKRPNFVVFLTDDLGWGDLGCYGHPAIKTPNLDAFARQGVRFTQCYAACPVCSPSRSAILTGRTPYRNGVFTWIPAGSPIHLRKSEITIAKLLQQRGYATCHVGKWHLNGKFNSPDQPQPGDHGYDWWLATQNNAAPSHKHPVNFVRNGKPVGRTDGYSAPLIVEEAVRWLREHREADKPFFLAVWAHEPHLPIESDPKFMAEYGDLADAGLRQHHGNVTQIDHAFGELMKALDKLGEADNTFVLFTSDNGPEGNGRTGRTRGSTGGLRGRKRSVYEGGIRVPGILRWPGRAKPGSVSHEPVVGSDLFTTVCEIAGIPLPSDRTIDGASLLPALESKPVRRKLPMYWRYGGAPYGLHVALRDGDWKILASADLTRFELYNLRDDPKETTDLAAKEPDRFEQMKKKLAKLNAEIEAEGPDWWKGYHKRRGRPRPLTKGKDHTGFFDEVKGCVVKKHEMGFALAAGAEGFAVKKLPQPVTKRVTFELKYKTLTRARTRNAMLVFGQKPTNADLVKCGTAIGMGNHAIFHGAWDSLQRGKLLPGKFDPARTFAATVTVDLGKKTIDAVIDGRKLSVPLPKGIERIGYYGCYVKATQSAFSTISIEHAE